MVSRGVIYAVTGDKYQREALKSAESLKKSNPDLHVTIFSDKHIDSEYVNECTVIPSEGKRPKVDLLSDTPYDQTIYLDSDTYVTGDLTPMYELLSGFDIGAVQPPTRRYEYGRTSEYKKKNFHEADYSSEQEFRDETNIDVPESFPAYNTGVLVYENNDATMELFDLWSKIYKEYRELPTHTRDQPPFRQAVFDSDVKIATLPPEYNCWVRGLYEDDYLQQYLIEEVKIFHGRSENMEQIADSINSHVLNYRTPYVVKPKDKQYLIQEKLLLFWRSLRRDGIGQTVRRIGSFLKSL